VKRVCATPATAQIIKRVDADLEGVASCLTSDARTDYATSSQWSHAEPATRAGRPAGLCRFGYLVEVATEMAKAGYDYPTEFALGLDLILDGLEGLRDGA